MNKYILSIISIISLPFLAQEKTDLLLPELGDRVSGAVSSSQEKMIGKEFLKQVYFQAPLITDSLIQEYTELLIYRLSEYSEVKDRNFTVILIDDASLNAFAAPGGIIGVNGGLFLNADNEGQFASVLSHELAHLSQRHFARNVLNAKDRSLTSSLAMISSIALALISSNPQALAVGQAFLQTQGLRYSRLFEKSMGEMFENMNDLRKLAGEAPPEFLLTHPLSSSRINDAMNAAEGLSDEGTKKDTLEYSLIKSRLRVLYESIPAQSIRYFSAKVDEEESDLNIYGLALAYSANNNFIDSLNLINFLIKKYPKNLFLNTSKVEILIKAKKYNQALKLVNEFLEISPKNYPLTINKSKVLLELNRFFESEEIVRDLLIRRNEDPQLWLMLSEIQRSSKNIVGYHQSRAEYFLLLGQNEEALGQLEFALNLTKNNFQVSERIMDQIISIKKEMSKARAL